MPFNKIKDEYHTALIDDSVAEGSRSTTGRRRRGRQRRPEVGDGAATPDVTGDDGGL